MICDLCHKEINEEKDKYTHVEDWNCKEKKNDMWCHFSCFQQAMNKDVKELEAKAKAIITKSGNILSKFLPEKYSIC